MIQSDQNGVLNVDVEALKTALNEEGGAEKVAEEFKKYKAYTTDQFSSMLNNYAKDAKERWRDEIYSDHKRDILGSAEKKIKEEFGMDGLEGGKDYKTINDLLKMVIDKNKSGDSGQNDTEKEQMRQKIKELSEKVEGMVPKAELTKIKNSIFDRILDSEINAYAEKVDAEAEKVPAQLGFLKFTFDQRGYKIAEKDGKEVVLDKNGEALKDESFNYKTPQQVIASIASEVLTLKEGHAGGRGANNKSKGGSSPLAAIENRSELNDYITSKGIDPHSREALSIVAEWQKLKG